MTQQRAQRADFGLSCHEAAGFGEASPQAVFCDLTAVSMKFAFYPCPPCEIYERKMTAEQLLAAIASLPDKQGKRIYAHYILGMSKTEIARAEGKIMILAT